MAHPLQWTHCYKLLELHTERYYGEWNYLVGLLLRAVPPATSYNFLLDIMGSLLMKYSSLKKE